MKKQPKPVPKQVPMFEPAKQPDPYEAERKKKGGKSDERRG